jgi:Pentapeptide repeats (8 copies)
MIFGERVMDREELLRRYAAGERDFSGVDLSGVDVSEVDLDAEEPIGVDLTGINLSGAILKRTDLVGVIWLMPISVILTCSRLALNFLT